MTPREALLSQVPIHKVFLVVAFLVYSSHPLSPYRISSFTRAWRRKSGSPPDGERYRNHCLTSFVSFLNLIETILDDALRSKSPLLIF
jgi:hypothetical protein